MDTRMLNMISKTINVKCCSSHFYHQPPYVWRDSNISQHFRARTCRSQALEIIDCKWLGNKRLKVKVDFLSFVLNKPPPVAENKTTTQIGLTCQQLQPRITKTTNYIYNFDPFPLVNGFLQSPQVSLHSSKPDVIFWAGYRAIEQSETQIINSPCWS